MELVPVKLNCYLTWFDEVKVFVHGVTFHMYLDAILRSSREVVFVASS